MVRVDAVARERFGQVPNVCHVDRLLEEASERQVLLPLLALEVHPPLPLPQHLGVEAHLAHGLLHAHRRPPEQPQAAHAREDARVAGVGGGVGGAGVDHFARVVCVASPAPPVVSLVAVDEDASDLAPASPAAEPADPPALGLRWGVGGARRPRVCAVSSPEQSRVHCWTEPREHLGKRRVKLAVPNVQRLEVCEGFGGLVHRELGKTLAAVEVERAERFDLLHSEQREVADGLAALQ
mmetsp:Transcript_352/g.557  ORF Transcript_352/g.557 Transcript_352/m.557 type:complete len:238 (-) Transcript_352:611-1324(-)